MIKYELKCNVCRHNFERTVKTFNHLKDCCPKCGERDFKILSVSKGRVEEMEG